MFPATQPFSHYKFKLIKNNRQKYILRTKAKCDIDYYEHFQKAKQQGKKLIVQVAPAVRVSVSEGFDLPPGTITPQQLVSGLKTIGFDYVFDTLWSADATIFEEGTEFLHRLVNGELDAFPLFTSCCPSWIKLAEKSFPSMLPFVSTTKSPMMIMGATIKHILPSIINVSSQDLYSTALMPCVNKQGEADKHKEEHDTNDVELVFTTNDVITIFKEHNIDLPNIQETPFDNPFGSGTGGSVIFGKTRGVMIAALRYAYLLLTKEQLGDVQFRPMEEIKDVVEATITLTPTIDNPFNLTNKEISFQVAVITGLGGVKKFIEYVKSKKTDFKFVEVMACPQGCISGAGNPAVGKNKELLTQRREALSRFDNSAKKKSSQENEDVQIIYEEYIGKPNDHTAHKLYHTHYNPKPPAN